MKKQVHECDVHVSNLGQAGQRIAASKFNGTVHRTETIAHVDGDFTVAIHENDLRFAPLQFVRQPQSERAVSCADIEHTSGFWEMSQRASDTSRVVHEPV